MTRLTRNTKKTLSDYLKPKTKPLPLLSKSKWYIPESPSTLKTLQRKKKEKRLGFSNNFVDVEKQSMGLILYWKDNSKLKLALYLRTASNVLNFIASNRVTKDSAETMSSRETSTCHCRLRHVQFAFVREPNRSNRSIDHRKVYEARFTASLYAVDICGTYIDTVYSF